MSRTFWFSPVPPARTDIAQYSLRVVPHLAKLITLEVVHPDPVPNSDRQAQATPKIPDLVSRSTHSVTMRQLNASHPSLYNIGNNPVFHSQILATAIRHPGIVILHDRSLQDLCYATLDATRTGENGMGSYLTAMAHWYGRAGRDAARAALAAELPLSDLAADFPLFEVALHGALGAVTHNPEIAAEISQRFPGMPVATLHLPYETAKLFPHDVPALAPDRPIRLAMFGYLNPNRRVCDVLRTWAHSPWRDRFELDLAGEMYDASAVRAVIAETGLGGQIRDHGFLPDDRLDALIGSAHLVLNLRNPTMGEASGSQLRIWANGAASVVSDTGWYSALPQGSALRISTEHEHSDLLALLADLASGRIDLAAYAQRGRECLAASDPAAYALALVNWLERESDSIFTRWAETALIEATARAYALCTPPWLVPGLPERLLA